MKKRSVFSSETLKTTYTSTQSILQKPTILIPSFIVPLSSYFQSCEKFQPHTLSGDVHVFFFFFSPSINSQIIRYSMSWCAGCLSWWGPLQRGDLSRGFNHCWLLLAPRNWGFDRKSNSTNYPDHGHHGDHPPTRKNPHGRTGNRTRDLVISSQKLWPLDHEAGRCTCVYVRIATG